MEVAEARREAVGVDQDQAWVKISLKVQPCPYNLNTRLVAHRVSEASIMKVVGGVVEAVVATTTSMAVVAMKARHINLHMVAITTSISLRSSTKSSTGLVSLIVRAILTNTRCSQLRINNPSRCLEVVATQISEVITTTSTVADSSSSAISVDEVAAVTTIGMSR